MKEFFRLSREANSAVHAWIWPNFEHILMLIKGRNSVENLQKITLYNPNLDLVNDDVHTKLVKFCPFIHKIWSKNQILTSIKGRKSVANLKKNNDL